MKTDDFITALGTGCRLFRRRLGRAVAAFLAGGAVVGRG